MKRTRLVSVLIASVVFASLVSFSGLRGQSSNLRLGLSASAATTPEPDIHVSGGGSVVITWKSGKSQAYTSDAYANFAGLYSVAFIPSHGWHIGNVILDGNALGIFDEDGFSLIGARFKSTMSVTFLENGGIDDVKSGLYVDTYPYPYVALVFDDVLTMGFVYAHPVGLAYQPPNAISEFWDIQTNASFVPYVTVILVLNLSDSHGVDPALLKMLRAEPELARADVNSDGIVDGTDVSIVAYANPSQPGDPRYNPRLDMNNDGLINDQDVNIVNNYIGQSVWQDITSQVIVSGNLVYVYGVTDHFSIFGVT